MGICKLRKVYKFYLFVLIFKGNGFLFYVDDEWGLEGIELGMCDWD